MKRKFIIPILAGIFIMVLAVRFLMPMPASSSAGSNPRIPLPSGSTISTKLVKFSRGDATVLTITNIAPILRCPKNTAPYTLEAKLSRDVQNEVVARVWSSRGDMELNVDGAKACGRSNHKFGPEKGITLGRATIPEYDKSQILITATTPPSQSRKLLIKVKNQTKMHDLPSSQDFIGEGTFVDNYPIAVFEKMKIDEHEVFHWTSYLLVDLNLVEPIGEIPLEKNLAPDTSGISFALDAKSEALVAVDLDLHWLMIIDLAKLHEKQNSEVETTVR